MKQFQELHQAVCNDRRYSPWSMQKTLSERAQMLQEEESRLWVESKKKEKQ